MFALHLIAWGAFRRSHRNLVPAERGRVTIREAGPADRDAVVRLAGLDSAPVPSGRLLVAERDGQVVAALALEGGRAIADPFQRTADVARLLEMRAEQIGATRAAGPRETRHGVAAPRPA